MPEGNAVISVEEDLQKYVTDELIFLLINFFFFFLHFDLESKSLLLCQNLGLIMSTCYLDITFRTK